MRAILISLAAALLVAAVPAHAGSAKDGWKLVIVTYGADLKITRDLGEDECDRIRRIVMGLPTKQEEERQNLEAKVKAEIRQEERRAWEARNPGKSWDAEHATTNFGTVSGYYSTGPDSRAPKTAVCFE